MRISLRRLAALVLAAGVTAAPLCVEAAPTGKWVTAYYGSYFWDNPEYQQPQYVDFTAMTHFVFARVGPGGGQMGGQPGQVMPGGGTAQSMKSVGPGAPNQTVEDWMIARAHANNVKALLMLGGEGDGPGFTKSTQPDVRPLFVKNLIDYLAAHDYDGIDVDWENVTTTSDQDLLEALVADLRAAANAHPRWAQSGFLITYPAGMLNTNIDRVSAHSVRLAAMVDQFNLMSYGMGWFGMGWQSTVFAPLTGQNPQRPMDIASSVQAYVDAGIPRSKIGMGIGFYGMNYKPPFSAPGKSTDGYPMDTWSVNDYTWSYNKLAKYGYLSNGEYHWDAATQNAYRTYPGGYAVEGRPTSGYLSYEDPTSIAAKGAWALSTAPNAGVGGTIVWVLNYGTTDGVNNPLMAAVKKAFLDPSAPGEGPPPPPPPTPAIITSTMNISSDWGSGYCASVVVNNEGQMAGEWNVSFPFSDTVANSWNAVFTVADGKLSVAGQEWNRVVYPGEPRTAGFCANRPPKAPPPPAPVPEGALSGSVTITSDWTSGYCASIKVANSSSVAINNWSISLPVQGTVQNLWNGKFTQSGASITLAGPDWNPNLAAGASNSSIGFCASR
ncbi:glycosyl hydrolase family 18 protein [Massilia sp. TS11]|uniref:glycosyl hydrolase family 18 protein n=1 Tax=Massilia sp. TS11 TaxID=2908003 RepID=UPI001EDA3F80|nr:glycosyl hydrolase family 18 protein [Massilia sp. TS11]MCG2585287.1 glycosyl hydrolase family 18 protein [Massilia sp. TS11]